MLNFLAHTAVLFLLAFPAAVADGPTSNDYVKLEVRPASAVRPGTGGIIEFHLLPAEGIHVNADPPLAFLLDSASSLTLDGKPLIPKDTITGYLSTTEPVRQAVLLDRKAKPGVLTVKGTVTFFYCSESEGWCNKQREPVEFTIIVKP